MRLKKIAVNKTLLTPALCLCCFITQALDVTQVNLAYQYEAFGAFNCQYRVSQSEGQLHIYYTLTSDGMADYQQFFLLQQGYQSQSHDTLTSYTLDTLAISKASVAFRLSFSATKKNLLLITLANRNEGVYRIYDVGISSPSGFPTFIPTTTDGWPVLTTYVTADEINISGSNKEYHVFRYQDNFGPADPAMGTIKPIAPSLDIDSSFYVSRKLSNLKPYHFYLIQSDTMTDNGVTLLKCPSYYPEYRKLEELVKPLTYITTPNENKTLRNQMSRKAFENFWINTYGTKFRAKSAIKIFYDKIEEANLLFTDYKQGWKTDRGVIYIIFGQPDEVIRSDRTEVWRYNGGIEFEFIRISTLFTPSLYSLKRNKKYEELWYDQVGSIRKGL